MSTPNGPRGPAYYELRVDGHLDPLWSTWFGGLALTLEDDGTTTLSGDVTDQAGLHGLLARIRDLGATLISVEALDDGRPLQRRAPEDVCHGWRSLTPAAAQE
jgi:hypothetical protein